MRFFKECAILIIIIVFVGLIEIITDDITDSCIKDVNEKISDLEKNLETDLSKSKMEELSETWKYRENKLSYYMEHNELEKISTEVTNLKSNIENDNDEEVQKEIDEIKFRLQHIKNKQKCELENIF